MTAIDTTGMDRLFSRLRKNEIPKAKRNAARDMAFDGRGRMIEEMKRVFDRPTKAVLSVPYVKKDDTGADLYLSDYLDGKRGAGPSHAITPHMGVQQGRGRKGTEKRLERMGRIGRDEWMIPAARAELDGFGNIRGSVAQKMLADIGANEQYAGDSANTNPNDRMVRGRKGKPVKRRGKVIKYFWIDRPGQAKGIYRKTKDGMVPVMVAVRGPLNYVKRYRWDEVIRSYAAKRAGYHARRAVDQAIARRR